MVKNIAIVSLSSGVIGEDFVKHEIEIGTKRLNEWGLHVRFMPHARKGIAYVKEHPEDRAKDLLEALTDDSIDMILCAIGGDDTYRLLPYLFANGELAAAVSQMRKDKVFLGFSDTTFNHLMLHKVGVPTFYGQAFLPDVCEIGTEMLPYSNQYFKELIETGTIQKVEPSAIWYEERTDFSEAAIGTKTAEHENEGFQLLQGSGRFSGEILGGCIESLFDIFDNSRYQDSVEVCRKYEVFPDLSDWKGKILLLESCEEKSTPAHYKEMLEAIKTSGVFEVVSGVICGKPMDETYFEEYKQLIVSVVDNPELPIVANINVGHAQPRCIIPFGVQATVDVDRKVITFG